MRHNCGKNGWNICTACAGRIHLDGCTSKRDPNRDCCEQRHKKLHAKGQTTGIDDAAVPMLGTHASC